MVEFHSIALLCRAYDIASSYQLVHMEFNNFMASGWFWRFSQKKQQFSVALPMP